ncbi:MAG: aminotransferase class V-fold PLP-dependent enzyme [Gemmatimonadetes bacterium]|nr:aminotransferase class V-fold PLP-dependent enzyme [Gemmatimonadota bacterium]
MIDSAPIQLETASSAEVFRSLRNTEFPWTAETVYLNNAGIGPIPERTRRLLDQLTARRTAPYLLDSRELHAALQEARVTVARLLGAQPDEIALATNTTYGLNLAAGSLPLRPGEKVILSDREFPANVYPWLRLRERGVEVELVPTTGPGWPDEARLEELLHDPRVRVLAISSVQFASGYKADLNRLGALCRTNGTYLVVDAIQAMGHVPLDVRRTPVDILACGGQKWLLSPWGSGFVYLRRELIAHLEPVVCGWMSFEGTDDFSQLTHYNSTLRPDARRGELATLPFQDLMAMKESIALLLELGVERIEAYIRTLREPLYYLARCGRLNLVSPTDPKHDSAIVCVQPEHVAEGYHALKKAHVVCALREGTIRLSPHCYNTVEEIEKVAGILVGE